MPKRVRIREKDYLPSLVCWIWERRRHALIAHVSYAVGAHFRRGETHPGDEMVAHLRLKDDILDRRIVQNLKEAPGRVIARLQCHGFENWGSLETGEHIG